MDMIHPNKSINKPPRIIAIMTIRNEELYLETCIRHLISQGVEVCVIDNDSTDSSSEIAKSYLGRGLIRYEKLTYPGYFDLSYILKNEEKIASKINADWIIRHDADEIREAPRGYGTLHEAIRRVDSLGFNAINFDEFVFLPANEDESFVGRNYFQDMKYYYYFQPRLQHHVKAWKTTGEYVSLGEGGHIATFPDRLIFPENFILRHYIGLSANHLRSKYCSRRFSTAEVMHGWHSERPFIGEDNLNIPSKEELILYDREKEWDRSDPKKDHLIFQKAHKTISPHPINKPPAPVIFGLAGSGTTLLRLILDVHPFMSISDETYFPYAKLKEVEEGGSQLERFISFVMENNLWKELHHEKEIFKRELRSFMPFSISDGLRLFFATYAYRLHKPRWGNKAPMCIDYIGTITRLLPEVRFIHVIRDGRDIAVSTGLKTYRVKINLEEHATNWQNSILQVREIAKKLPFYTEVLYEQLVTDPEGTLKTLCEFIELPYDKQMLDYHFNAKEGLSEICDRLESDGSGMRFVSQEETPAVHEMNMHPLTTSRIGRWKHELSEEEVTTFQNIAGKMLKELGYELL